MILTTISKLIKSLFCLKNTNDEITHSTFHVTIQQQTPFPKKQPPKTKIKKKINPNKLIDEIKHNIIYLSGLLEQMEDIIEYQSYYQKVDSLKQQSKGCLRILFRLNQRAPYYKTTIKMVYEHTKEISSLVNFQV